MADSSIFDLPVALTAAAAHTDLIALVDVSDTTDSADGTTVKSQAIYVLGTQRVNAQTGTTYTLALSDAGAVVTCSNAAAVSVTVPPNSSVAFPVGCRVDIIGIGAGIVTIVEGDGVTVSKTTGQTLVFEDSGSACTLVKLATDTWRVVGRFADV